MDASTELWTKLENTEKALAKLDEVARQYPNSPSNDLIKQSLEKREHVLHERLEHQDQKGGNNNANCDSNK